MQDQPRGDLRALKALVVGMGVLIVLGTALVVGVAVRRIYARPAAPSMPRVAIAGVQPFALPPGAHVAGIAGAGDALAVWISGAAGDQVLLVDPATGAVRVVVSTAR